LQIHILFLFVQFQASKVANEYDFYCRLKNQGGIISVQWGGVESEKRPFPPKTHGESQFLTIYSIIKRNRSHPNTPSANTKHKIVSFLPTLTKSDIASFNRGGLTPPFYQL
jgi:hypothetical protein